MVKACLNCRHHSEVAAERGATSACQEWLAQTWGSASNTLIRCPQVRSTPEIQDPALGTILTPSGFDPTRVTRATV